MFNLYCSCMKILFWMPMLQLMHNQNENNWKTTTTPKWRTINYVLFGIVHWMRFDRYVYWFIFQINGKELNMLIREKQIQTNKQTKTQNRNKRIRIGHRKCNKQFKFCTKFDHIHPIVMRFTKVHYWPAHFVNPLILIKNG